MFTDERNQETLTDGRILYEKYTIQIGQIFSQTSNIKANLEKEELNWSSQFFTKPQV